MARLGLALAIPALATGFGLLGTGAASASTTAYTPVHNGGPAKLCLDVKSEDGLSTAYARVQLYHCTGVSEQAWFENQAGVLPTGNTAYNLRPRSDPQMCIEPGWYSGFIDPALQVGLIGDQGAQVLQAPCIGAGDASQAWIYISSTHEFQNEGDGECLDATGAGSTDREMVIVEPCNNDATQHWSPF